MLSILPFSNRYYERKKGRHVIDEYITLQRYRTSDASPSLRLSVLWSKMLC